MDFNFKDKYGIDDLIKIMEILRSENGCPWDVYQGIAYLGYDLEPEAYTQIQQKIMC